MQVSLPSIVTVCVYIVCVCVRARTCMPPPKCVNRLCNDSHFPSSIPQWASHLPMVRQGRPTFDEEVRERERQKAEDEERQRTDEANRAAGLLSHEELAALWLGD